MALTLRDLAPFMTPYVSSTDIAANSQRSFDSLIGAVRASRDRAQNQKALEANMSNQQARLAQDELQFKASQARDEQQHQERMAQYADTNKRADIDDKRADNLLQFQRDKEQSDQDRLREAADSAFQKELQDALFSGDGIEDVTQRKPGWQALGHTVDVVERPDPSWKPPTVAPAAPLAQEPQDPDLAAIAGRAALLQGPAGMPPPMGALPQVPQTQQVPGAPQAPRPPQELPPAPSPADPAAAPGNPMPPPMLAPMPQVDAVAPPPAAAQPPMRRYVEGKTKSGKSFSYDATAIEERRKQQLKQVREASLAGVPDEEKPGLNVVWDLAISAGGTPAEISARVLQRRAEQQRIQQAQQGIVIRTGSQVETGRHNAATEALGGDRLVETGRHNAAGEALGTGRLGEEVRYHDNVLAEREAARVDTRAWQQAQLQIKTEDQRLRQAEFSRKRDDKTRDVDEKAYKASQDSTVKAWKDSNGAKNTEQLAGYKLALSNMTRNPDSIIAYGQAAQLLARENEKGALSDRDLAIFFNSGSAQETINNWLNNRLTGTTDPQLFARIKAYMEGQQGGLEQKTLEDYVKLARAQRDIYGDQKSVKWRAADHTLAARYGNAGWWEQQRKAEGLAADTSEYAEPTRGGASAPAEPAPAPVLPPAAPVSPMPPRMGLPMGGAPSMPPPMGGAASPMPPPMGGAPAPAMSPPMGGAPSPMPPKMGLPTGPVVTPVTAGQPVLAPHAATRTAALDALDGPLKGMTQAEGLQLERKLQEFIKANGRAAHGPDMERLMAEIRAGGAPKKSLKDLRAAEPP